MKQKELSLLLRGIVLLCGLVGLFFAYVFGKTLLLTFIEPERILTPTALICLMLALVLLAMIDAWLIFTRIGQNNSFCKANAHALRRISFYALIATVLDLILTVYTLVNSMEPRMAYQSPRILARAANAIDGEVLLFASIAVAGVAATVASAALSHLTLKAANLQDENDLTI